ncbi:MAG: hypothetical protein Aurels2KO_38310 [Aureliella sp.]
MNSPQVNSCYLIGADSLLIECGKILLDKGFVIHGVISNNSRIRRWAVDAGLAVIAQDEDYPSKLREHRFDILFSITNLSIIPDYVLALPEKMTVNFHDGPLPAYAGLNAPAWALIDGVEEYGITWHEITAGVDEGKLLKQVKFGVSSDETSLSINTKCFAAALESFPSLVDELANDETRPVPQDLTQRSYFAKHKIPPAAGLIDWQQPATDIAAFVRAMNFGDYPNPITVPKLKFSSTVLGVLTATASSEATEASQPPGTVLSITDDSIDVATGAGTLSISQLVSLDGSKHSPWQAADLLGITPPDCFERLSEETAQILSSVSKKAIRQDTFWVDRFSNLEPADVPLGSRSVKESTSPIAKIEIPPYSDTPQPLSVALSAFAIAIAKCLGKDAFDIAIASDLTGSSGVANAPSISSWVPLRFDLSDEVTSRELVTNVERQLADLGERGVWTSDLFCRYPTISQYAKQIVGNCLPIAVQSSSEPVQPGAQLALSMHDDGSLELHFAPDKLSRESAERLASYTSEAGRFLAAPESRRVSSFDIVVGDERQLLLEQWNDTYCDYDSTKCIHEQIEDQVAASDSAVALIFADQQLTYAELNDRANQVAEQLIQRGVGAESLVGVHVQRSLDLVIATLGVLKAGAAYVPLDPAFPSDRIAYMIQDAKMPVVISQLAGTNELPESNADVIAVEDLYCPDKQAANPQRRTAPDKLAYVIYTSGSTGNPKGVMVEHRNAANFFKGMDGVVDHDPPGVWLAVTSLSFDISVLELLWTLARGFKVVIYRESRDDKPSTADRSVPARKMHFGLFMWGNDDAEGRAKYQLLIEGAKYFDEHGFDAVWTPERHFGAFGGPYPNPAVTSAAVASVTKNIAIRSGSIVSPLHHPVRIAEDWAVVDNLSDGRVGLSFAAGWQPNDFVIMPQNHANNKQIMLEQIETVRKLWRGESVEFANPKGEMVPTSTLPRPVQKELPIWLTTAGNPESYRQAGLLGTNVLTHLLGQTVEEVAEKIAIYRKARAEAGLDPAADTVSLMLHTFVGANDDEVRELVREPMKEYLRSSMKLVLDFAWSFPAFKRPGGNESKPDEIDIKSLSPDEIDTILDFAFERYYENSGLFGTPERCMEMINRCRGADVDEIACLLDFGAPTERVMQSLPALNELRELANKNVTLPGDTAALPAAASEEATLPDLIARHGVTHFQCTPSMARMLTYDDTAKRQLGSLKHMMVGGEPLSQALAKDLREILSGRLTNMYGPTETTVWSTTKEIENAADITIGRPIANTQIYICDNDMHPVPVGVPGHLYIGGDGVVRGYLNREELTSERFRPNPFGGNASRIYWTGDLARYRSDGTIEFLGRSDHQVKIRGYRIELGEIESALSLLDGIREAVVVYREPTPGDQRLVAFVVVDSTDEGQAPVLADIRNQLRASLPEYMLPNDLVTLDALPLTPNGKVDRKRLPEVTTTPEPIRSEFVAPESDLERTIAGVWQETLCVESVGLKDNFFDLGGHSLLIVQVHQKLKQQIETPLSLTDLYRFPTIRTLTDHLSSDSPDEAVIAGVSRASRRRERLGLQRRRSR